MRKNGKARTMSYYEKWSLAISIIAIIAAIAGPILTYFILDPQVQAFRNRAQLKVASSSFMKTTMMSNNGKPVGVPIPAWELEIRNTGSLPARDVTAILRYQRYKDPETGLEETSRLPSSSDEIQLSLSPPSRYEIEILNNEFVVSLKTPIAPGDAVRLNAVEPDSVWVSNDSGEFIMTQTAAGLRRQMDHMPLFPLGHRVR